MPLRYHKRLIILGIMIALGLGYLGISLSTEESSTAPPHGEAPSLDCFGCHGPHPPKDAGEIGSADFEIPSHAPSLEPPPEVALTCSQCHEYPAELEEVTPNSCLGCHERGGYSVKAALEALIEAGHPDVISAMGTVPDDCRWCHRDLGQVLHRRHLFESPIFVPHFQTGCTRCHLLGEDGEPTIESQPFE